ncbi:hypothetical protein JANAI62_18750 [Jannaschia pagri]|uniref:Glycosyltransferase 2-like domain-containing protein n=1 Tax=Jannaschia pagri TaxID=2829797 RepID=A0ABQ4NLG8_9RHOB|nr:MULTISPECIES: glycosyltransferase family A protein [unclassified Jannaschia]GIT91418.1 hypothetical protein JANAI61_18760 [Jannaschia sp. AI_61]GIT95252.1 hypothetical protein JANAI62_18750 [Jannaschia sp. AI_62]
MTLRATLRDLASRVLPRPAGYVDHFDADRVAGWAVDPAGSGQPVTLSLHVDGQHVMNVAADLPREDVSQSGRAPLRCGFDIALPSRLRDGQAHAIEVRIGQDGPRLRGGKLTLDAGMAGRGASGAAARPIEGVAWYDRSRAAVAGWATGCGTVSIAVDGGPPSDVPLDREVPGLGAGNRQGFLFPLSDDLADGHPHDIVVRAGHWADGEDLDGSPLRLSLGAARPRLSVVADPAVARGLCLNLRDRDGAPSRAPVTVHVDGVERPRLQPDAGGVFALSLPEEARHLTVSTAPEVVSPDTPAMVLGRFVIASDGRPEDWSPDVPRPALDTVPLDAALLDEAVAAFAAFAQDPDGRFDPVWVAAAAGLLSPDAALTHWRDGGAVAGLAPGPAFDEAAARALHPGVAVAIAAGRLPCAFALELVLGAGALGTMTGLAVRRSSVDPAPLQEAVATPLPPITTWCDPADSIYAAWLARLDATPDQRAMIEADERAARSEVAAAPLLHRPLVSIIMPSWNRAFTIGEAIQSVLDQSYGNWELLICDDASEDRTADVIRDFKDERIRYMRFQKSNGAGARNHGLRMARGEYIAYLDSDNMWHPLFLDVMLRRLMAKPGVPIAYGAYLDTETKGARVILQDISRPPFRPVQLSGKNFMDLNTIMHHRRVVDWLGGFDGRLPRLQDWDMVLRHTSVFGAQFVDRIGVFYRRNIAWGQVTQTQQGSGAQDTVNGKTQARLAGAHERLDLDWPAPSRVTLIGAATGPETRSTICALADLCAQVGAVDLVWIGDGAPTLSGVSVRTVSDRLMSDPARLGTAIADVTDAPVIALGIPDAVLSRVPSLDPTRTLRLVGRATGTWVEALSGPAAFPIGALPCPEVTQMPRGSTSYGVVLVLGPERALADPAWVAALGENGLQAVVPPTADHPNWSRVDSNGRQSISDPDVLPEGMADVALTLVMGPSLADLSPWQMALLNGMQARGIPAAVPSEADPESLAAQWIDAKAAYALTSHRHAWVFDKLAKLNRDANTMARLTDRSRTVHRIALAPELARERVVHMLWRMQFAPPRVEVLDGR